MIKINLTPKIFGKLKAIDDITLTIEEGDIYGSYGPNGAR